MPGFTRRWDSIALSAPEKTLGTLKKLAARVSGSGGESVKRLCSSSSRKDAASWSFPSIATAFAMTARHTR